MALTGFAFLTLVTGVTLVAFVALVALWPALAGRSVRRVAARAGLLLLVNVLVVLTAATQLNAQFLFFADWTDLHGALTNTIVKTSLSRGQQAQHAAERAVRGLVAHATPTQPPLPKGAKGGDVLTYTVTGPVSGITAKVVVRLPPSYTRPDHQHTLYPVLEAFGGYPSSPRQWVDVMHIGDALSKAATSSGLVVPLVVSPEVEIPSGVDTECVNGSTGLPQVETWLAEDVPAWVAETFRVQTDRDAWATIGLSAGGWCAAEAALLHPAQYGGAIVLGGYFRPELGPFYEPYLHNGALSRRYDLIDLAKHHPPSVALWLETSHSDSTSYGSSAAFLKATHAPLAVTAVVLRHAGHRTALWRALLPQAFQWLSTSLPGFSQHDAHSLPTAAPAPSGTSRPS